MGRGVLNNSPSLFCCSSVQSSVSDVSIHTFPERLNTCADKPVLFENCASSSRTCILLSNMISRDVCWPSPLNTVSLGRHISFFGESVLWFWGVLKNSSFRKGNKSAKAVCTCFIRVLLSIVSIFFIRGGAVWILQLQNCQLR